MRNAYWDSVLVCDGEIDSNTIDEWKGVLGSANRKSTVDGTPESESLFFASKPNRDVSDAIFDKLRNIGIMPVLENHKVWTLAKLHRMNPGGKMARHNDYDYSLAATIYLSDCVGGELKVYSGYDQDLLIKPVTGRVVVLKCDNDHQVLEVESGIRESIQLFVRYEHETRSKEQLPT